MTTETISGKAFNAEHASKYDLKSMAANWLDPDIIFGLSYRYITPGETILDVGIGTGLSSILFHQAGLKVVGLDLSMEMLNTCRNKNFALYLIRHDLAITPYPLENESVDHTVCTGVMHILNDLETIFSEVSRIIKPGGIFAFVVADSQNGETQESVTSKCSSDRAKYTFNLHPQAKLDELYQNFGLEQINSLRFLSSSIGKKERIYKACLARKI